ncbi:uncharacterized protein LOC102678124 [Apis dorsata]|uniref:uncharacterized protein LOC102678124 n=1 Tax=Apis dorsata TaxID=7462 RepID=UPI001292F9DC|nr:uncharacterized protein LOC102678124 [Apis dorsata]
MIISSRDLHESFVEPLELVDDSDKDIRVRLGRSLKSVENSGIVASYVGSSSTERSANGSSARIAGPIENKSTRSMDRGFALVASSPLDVEKLFKDEGRVKRQVSLPYDAYYDEVNQRVNPDSEMMYYNRYMKNEENDHFQPLNPYENIPGNKLSDMKDFELGKDVADDYNRISRNKDPAKKKKHAKKKHNNNNKNNNKLKKKRKKIRKTKPSKKTRRKRRHHKKQPKIKDREKKRKKSMKNRHNIKKIKIDQSEEDKYHDQRKRHHGKGRKNTMNSINDIQRRKINTFLVADNMEDESQMDLAVHGELAGKIVEQIFDQVFLSSFHFSLSLSLFPSLG